MVRLLMSRYVIERNDVITLTRGDYFERDFKFYNGKFPNEHPLILNEGDIIFFGLMDPHMHFEHALIKKEFNNESVSDKGVFKLVLDSEDTLDLVAGTYYYSIKLLTKDGRIKTLVKRSLLTIVE